MNFFAHYYFHHKPDDHWHNAGLLFPDLLRIFSNGQRISENNWSKSSTAESHIPLSIGIENHFRADEIFHNWYWFKDMNHELALKIREGKTGLKRDWFIGHILIELAIDHVLVNENESLVNALYLDLERCDKQGWTDFFANKNLGEPDQWYDGYMQFVTHRYIFTYKDTVNIIYALNRIYQRTGIGNFDDAQNQFLLVILNDFIPALKLKIVELGKILE